MSSAKPTRQKSTERICAEIAQRIAAGKPTYRLRLELESRSVDPRGGRRRIRLDKPDSALADSRKLTDSRERHKKAADLIQRWLDDESDHDERFWPILKEELEDSRLRCRE